jgi:putative MFS transporter
MTSDEEIRPAADAASAFTVEGPGAGGSAVTALAGLGPLETRYARSRRYRDVIEGDVTEHTTGTHWNIAVATALGWTLDSTVGALYALIIPFLILDFHVSLNKLTLWVTITGLISTLATYAWPWLSDQVGRRLAFTINIFISGVFVVLTAISGSWLLFLVFYTLMRAATNGEWSIAANLTAETWPARHRAKVLSGARSCYGLGVALAGLMGTYIIPHFGWRWAFALPAVVALVGFYVRLYCPESPYWVRTKERRARISDEEAKGNKVSAEDQAWLAKADKPSISQLFEKGQTKLTLAAIFVAITAGLSWFPIGVYGPLFLYQTHHWTVVEYSRWYTWFGLVGIAGYFLMGWIADRWSRLAGMVVGNLISIAVVLPFTLMNQTWALWVFGLAADFGLIGVWGIVMAYTAELFPTRVRGTGQGFAWTVGGFAIFSLPYIVVWLRDIGGSFRLPFELVPAVLVIQLVGIFLLKIDYARRPLDAIRV